jgi:hypothetical protein
MIDQAEDEVDELVSKGKSALDKGKSKMNEAFD